MTIIRKPYAHAQDFIRVRNFLIETYGLYNRPFNWLIDRWNVCSYAVIPLHNFYNVRYFNVPTYPYHTFRDERPCWEKTAALWETDSGEIAGVVHPENETPGEAWIQIHPHYTHLYTEMVDFIETHLADKDDKVAYCKIYVQSGTPLEQIVMQRNYKKLHWGSTILEYNLEQVCISPPAFPAGYVLKSAAEEDDIDKRRMTKALAFGSGYAPSDWAPAEVFRVIQQAPDYRKEHDLFLKAPNGDYAAFCTIWLDEKNRYGVFEPVGTHCEYQGRGLGRLLLTEGLRRMQEYGMTRSFMDSGNPFYKKVGFKETSWTYYPWVKYFPLSPHILA